MALQSPLAIYRRDSLSFEAVSHLFERKNWDFILLKPLVQLYFSIRRADLNTKLKPWKKAQADEIY